MYKYIWRLLMLLLVGSCLVSCTSSKQPQAVQLTHPTPTTTSTSLGSLFHHREPKQVVPPLPSKEHYTVIFNNMDGYWKHGQAVIVKGVTVNTFIPQNEFVDKWTERIEITHVKVERSMTASKYYNEVIQSNLNNMCYYSVPKARIIRRSINDIIYEYHVLNCGKKPSLALIGRVMHNGNNINTITYTVKTDHLERAKRQYMLEIIETTQVM
jgi:hypothetical protein